MPTSSTTFTPFIVRIQDALSNPETNKQARLALFVVSSGLTFSPACDYDEFSVREDDDSTCYIMFKDFTILVTMWDQENTVYDNPSDFFDHTHVFYPRNLDV